MIDELAQDKKSKLIGILRDISKECSLSAIAVVSSEKYKLSRLPIYINSLWFSSAITLFLCHDVIAIKL